MIHNLSGRFDKRWEEALNEFNKMIEIDQKDAAVYYSRQNIFRGPDNCDQEIELCDSAIKLNPKYAKAYYYRGLTYSRIGNYDQAIADYDKAIEFDQKDAAKFHEDGKR